MIKTPLLSFVLEYSSISPYLLRVFKTKAKVDESDLRSAIFTEHRIPYISILYQGKRTCVAVYGVDFGFFKAKGKSKNQLTKKEIADLFGITYRQVDQLGLPINKEVYGAHQYVYPIYDYISSVVRKKVLKELYLSTEI